MPLFSKYLLIKPNKLHDVMSPCFSLDGKNLWGYIHVWKSGGTSVQDNCYDRKRSCRDHGKALMGPMLVKNELTQHDEMRMVRNKDCSRYKFIPRRECNMNHALKRYRIDVECGKNWEHGFLLLYETQLITFLQEWKNATFDTLHYIIILIHLLLHLISFPGGFNKMTKMVVASTVILKFLF